jgi:hypothetical protein
MIRFMCKAIPSFGYLTMIFTTKKVPKLWFQESTNNPVGLQVIIQDSMLHEIALFHNEMSLVTCIGST